MITTLRFRAARAPLLVGALLFVAAEAARATDWPQFLGPVRNGSTPDEVGHAWPDGTPKQRWKVKVGSGFAGPVVAAGKVIVFHRLGDEEVLTAFDALTGKSVFEQRTPTAYEDDFGFDNGPRAVPAVHEGRVVTLGAEGRLSCRSLADGAKLWEVDTKSRYRTDKGFFGVACSPLVAGKLVLLNLGGKDSAGVAAFDFDTGKLIWKHTDHEAGYASPTTATVDGRQLALFFTREGLVGVELASGKMGFTRPWRARMSASVNAASPLVVGSEVFLTTSYGVGGLLLALKADRVEPIWSNDESLSAHYATPVVKDSHLYGFHGRQESGPSLRCVEWRTGKVRWSEDGFGAGTLALAGSQLVVLRDTGELVIAAAAPDGFKAKARAQVIGANRAVFALADGGLYARDKSQLVSVDLKAN
jgi:outer membrane protein assembly factor BamB